MGRPGIPNGDLIMWPLDGRRTALERAVGRALIGEMEERNLEDPKTPLSSPDAYAIIFGGSEAESGVKVNRDSALSVPAVWCAVNFLGDTLGSLPVPVFRIGENGERIRDTDNPIAVLLHDWVNDDFLTSFEWRKQSMTNVLLDGRSFTFIEGKREGRIKNLWPLETSKVTVERVDNRRRYIYRDNGRTVIYGTDEIIDLKFLPAADGLGSYNPVEKQKNAIGLAIALEQYASKFFIGGGVPPLAMQMPASANGSTMRRAVANLQEVLTIAREKRRHILPMPEGHRLDRVGFNPEEGQLTEARKLQIIEIARIYNLPPTFLQDYERTTFSNAEQSDIQLTKHTIRHWARCWEQELNAKLFGVRGNNYIEFNLDGLLRGDFGTRMAGYAQAIQNGVLTPNEARELENRAPKDGGDDLMIQGATVPMKNAAIGEADAADSSQAEPDGGGQT